MNNNALNQKMEDSENLELKAEVPRFEVDLDTKPKDRWTHIIKAYENQIMAVQFSNGLNIR